MSVLITGAEFRDFYQNHWPADCWHEDAEYEIEDDNGAWVLRDDAILDVSKLGYVVAQGATEQRWQAFSEVWAAWKTVSTPLEIRTWRVPTQMKDEVEAFMAERGIEEVVARAQSS